MAEHDEELRALQKRAYGPSADIDGDASALSRLHELEARSRAAGQASGEGAAAAGATLVDAAPDDPVPRGRARRAAGTVASDLPASASASTPDAGTSPADPRPRDVPDDQPEALPATEGAAAAPRKHWWTGRIPLLWVGSLIVALAVGALSAMSIDALVDGRVAVLSVDADAEWPQSFSSGPDEGGVVFDDFEGLSVISITPRFGTGPDDDQDSRCLYVLTGAISTQGLLTAGCAAGSFPAVTSVVVTEDSPDSLRSAYDVGTALQFTLEDDRVLVDARRP